MNTGYKGILRYTVHQRPIQIKYDFCVNKKKD